MRIAAYVASTIVSIPGVVAGARTGDVAIGGVFSPPPEVHAHASVTCVGFNNDPHSLISFHFVICRKATRLVSP